VDIKAFDHHADLRAAEIRENPNLGLLGPVQNQMQYEKAKNLFSSIGTENLKAALGGSIAPEHSHAQGHRPHQTISRRARWEQTPLPVPRAMSPRMADQLQSGSVWVNSHFDVAPNAPFGGHKQSGMGSIHHTVSVSEAKSPNFAGVKIHRAHPKLNVKLETL
jgi:hypothetical protein